MRRTPTGDWFTDKELIGGDENGKENQCKDRELTVESIAERVSTTDAWIPEITEKEEESIHGDISEVWYDNTQTDMMSKRV